MASLFPRRLEANSIQALVDGDLQWDDLARRSVSGSCTTVCVCRRPCPSKGADTSAAVRRVGDHGAVRELGRMPAVAVQHGLAGIGKLPIVIQRDSWVARQFAREKGGGHIKHTGVKHAWAQRMLSKVGTHQRVGHDDASAAQQRAEDVRSLRRALPSEVQQGSVEIMKEVLSHKAVMETKLTEWAHGVHI